MDHARGNQIYFGSTRVKSPVSIILQNPAAGSAQRYTGLDFFCRQAKQENQSTKDFPDDRILFYDFYLAVAWWENNVGTAKDMLSNAVHGFRNSDLPSTKP